MIAESLTVEPVMVVSDFLDIFPIDLPRLPPEWEIDFLIKVELSIEPMSIPTYHVALVEHKELSTKL